MRLGVRMLKAAPLEVGHVSEHADGTRWRKVAPGKWEPAGHHPESQPGSDRRRAAVAFARGRAEDPKEKLSSDLAMWVHRTDPAAKRKLLATYDALSEEDKAALETDTQHAVQEHHGGDYMTVYRSMRRGDQPGDMGGKSVTTDLDSRPHQDDEIHAFRVHHKDVLLHWSQHPQLVSREYGHEHEVILKPNAEPEHLGPVDALQKPMEKAVPLELGPPRARPEEPEHPFVGHIVFQGLDIDIETAAGGRRSGVDKNGEPWSVRLPWPYGEIRGTRAVDGDAVDAFVGPNPYATHAWVVQAKVPKSKAFDEPKLLLGFDTRDQALACFRAAYTGPGFILGVQRWPMPALLEALRQPKLQGGRFGVRALQSVMRKEG